MTIASRTFKTLTIASMLAVPVAGGIAQEVAAPPQADLAVTVDSPPPAEMAQGPEVEGIISARRGDQMQVTTADGAETLVTITEATRVRGTGGFLGLGRSTLATNALLNGLPVTVKTLQSGGGLVASQINLKNRDLRTASMIRSGTAQGFAEQAAATEALRGRVADIDQYNVKSTTDVNFDSGKAVLSEQAKSVLCQVATSSEAMDNALLLVVGHADSTGDEEFNQQLSERRAGRVVNHLQQRCGWKPYRMLTPTGMSEADPVASNDTEEGKAQNRRVTVAVLVSKGLDGI
ncbi:OmpA family protein [Sphingomonas sp.]